MLEGAPALLRDVVTAADAESRRLRHGYVGSEHLLLALVGMTTLRAASLLAESRVDHARVSAEVTNIVGVGEEELPAGVLPFTPRAAGVIRRVAEEADRSGPDGIGSEHVLRALVRSRGAVAAQILADLGVDPAHLARTLRKPRPES